MFFTISFADGRWRAPSDAIYLDHFAESEYAFVRGRLCLLDPSNPITASDGHNKR